MAKPKSFKAKNGRIYSGSCKNDRVRITHTRTARGQNFTAGIFNTITREWEETVKIPNDVKRYFESEYPARKVLV